jgi:hypothetical protein
MEKLHSDNIELRVELAKAKEREEHYEKGSDVSKSAGIIDKIKDISSEKLPYETPAENHGIDLDVDDLAISKDDELDR